MEGTFTMKPSMIFEIQKIVGVSENGNVRNFQVQWAPSWVSDHYLVGCEKLIREFLGGLADCEQQRMESTQKYPPDTSHMDDVADTSHTDGVDNVDIKIEVSEDVDNQVSDTIDTPEVVSLSSETIVECNDKLHSKTGTASNSYSAHKFVSSSNIEKNCDSKIQHPSSSKNKQILGEETVTPEKEISNDTIPDYEVLIDLGSNEIIHSYSRPPICTPKSHSAGDGLINNSRKTIRTSNRPLPLTFTGSVGTNLMNDDGCNRTKNISVSNENNEIDQRDNNVLRNSFISQLEQYNNDINNENIFTKKYHTNSSLPCSDKEARTCRICGKELRHKSNMNRHIRNTHAGEAKYQCTICGKRWTQKNDLRRHMRRHTGEKPFQCSVCQKRFAWKPQLKLHRCLPEEFIE